jgi:hypothetical protein
VVWSHVTAVVDKQTMQGIEVGYDVAVGSVE